MIYGIGTDIVNIKRLKEDADFCEHFKEKIMSLREREFMAARQFKDIRGQVLYLAKRFAGKEAVVKALGTGFVKDIHLSDIEIFNDEQGHPFVELSGGAKRYINTVSKNEVRVHISLSDDYPYASAVAVIEE